MNNGLTVNSIALAIVTANTLNKSKQNLNLTLSRRSGIGPVKHG
jgi:hypothetical protein